MKLIFTKPELGERGFIEGVVSVCFKMLTSGTQDLLFLPLTASCCQHVNLTKSTGPQMLGSQSPSAWG